MNIKTILTSLLRFFKRKPEFQEKFNDSDLPDRSRLKNIVRKYSSYEALTGYVDAEAEIKKSGSVFKVDIKFVNYDNKLKRIIELLKLRLKLIISIVKFVISGKKILFLEDDANLKSAIFRWNKFHHLLTDKYAVKSGILKAPKISAKHIPTEKSIETPEELVEEVVDEDAEDKLEENEGLIMKIIDKYIKNAEVKKAMRDIFGKAKGRKGFFKRILKRAGKRVLRRSVGAIPVIGTIAGIAIGVGELIYHLVKGDTNQAISSTVGSVIALIPGGVGLALSIPIEIILLEVLDRITPNEHSEKRLKEGSVLDELGGGGDISTGNLGVGSKITNISIDDIRVEMPSLTPIPVNKEVMAIKPTSNASINAIHYQNEDNYIINKVKLNIINNY